MKKEKGCACHAARQSRWIEPSVLFLLCEKERHGYELMNDIPSLGFIQNEADPGAVYRTLRHLEEHGLVQSEWDTSGSGPAKRLYTITSLGKKQLANWAEALKERKQAIDSFLENVNKLSLKK